MLKIDFSFPILARMFQFLGQEVLKTFRKCLAPETAVMGEKYFMEKTGSYAFLTMYHTIHE